MRKRKSASRRRKSYATSAPRRRRRSRGLSDMGAGMLQNPIISVALGAIGGTFIMKKLEDVDFVTKTPILKNIGAGVVGFALGKIMKQPAIGHGFLAVAIADATKEPLGLNAGPNEATYVAIDSLSDAYSLSDPYSLSEGDDMLSAGDPSFEAVYPGYVNPGFYDDYTEITD